MSWNSVKLGDVCQVNPRDPALPTDAPFVPMGLVDVGVRHPTGYENRGQRGGIRARANDILFARITPCLENGKLAQLPPNAPPTGGSTEFLVVRPGPEVDPGFVYYWCMSPEVRRLAEASMTGTTGRMRLSGNHLASFELVYPPLDEQRRIVDLLEDHLSRLDAAEAGLRKAKQRLQSLERSALETHFSGGKQVSLGELVSDIAAGKSYGASSVPAGENDWGIIKVSAMTWGEFRSEENKKVPDERVDRRFEIKPGDLLVSRANTADYVGASVLVGQVRPKLLLSDKSLRITTKAGVSKEWLWRALQAPSARTQIRNLATGTKDSMRNISQAALRQIQVPLVDEVRQSEQLRAFSMTSAATARLRGELEQASIRHASLRKSLLAVAFSGRLTAEMPAAELVSP